MVTVDLSRVYPGDTPSGMRLKEQRLCLYFVFGKLENYPFDIEEAEILESLYGQLLNTCNCASERSFRAGKASKCYKLWNPTSERVEVNKQWARVLTFSSSTAFPAADLLTLEESTVRLAERLAPMYGAAFTYLGAKVFNTWTSTRYC